MGTATGQAQTSLCRLERRDEEVRSLLGKGWASIWFEFERRKSQGEFCCYLILDRSLCTVHLQEPIAGVIFLEDQRQIHSMGSTVYLRPLNPWEVKDTREYSSLQQMQEIHFSTYAFNLNALVLVMQIK